MYNDNSIEFKQVSEDYFEIKVNGVCISKQENAVWERSQIRQFIEEWDKQVND